MFRLGKVVSFCQIKLPCSNETSVTSENDIVDTVHGKWNTTHSGKDYFTEAHKVFTTDKYIFITWNNSLIIHDCTTSMDRYVKICNIRTTNEHILNFHRSNITCLSFDDASEILCTCSDEDVFLLRWDSILGNWDQVRVSEGEGRINSCTTVVKDQKIYITVFKSDAIVVYLAVAVHLLSEPGPLILESIDCLATLEKPKELTTHCKSILNGDVLRLVSVASGNAVSLKLWELSLGSKSMKLVDYQTVKSTKCLVSCDIQRVGEESFILVVGVDGNAEVYQIHDTGFDLLHRVKLEESNASFEDLDTTKLHSSNITLNQLQPTTHTDFRILCSKFFIVSPCSSVTQLQRKHSTDTEESNGKNSESGKSTGPINFRGSGDAGEPTDLEADFLLANLNNSFAESDTKFRQLCPRLMVVIATSNRISLINLKSGEVDLCVGYDELLKGEEIHIYHAKLAVNGSKQEVSVEFQSCMSRVVFCRRFSVHHDPGNADNIDKFSLIPSETLNPRSVLRKRIKSPPRMDPISATKIKGQKWVGGSRSAFFKQSTIKPAWARSRSRPLPNSGNQMQGQANHQTKSKPPLSARSHSRETNAKPPHFLVTDGLPSSRLVKIQVKGSYSDENLNFGNSDKINLNTQMSNGLSYLRLATSRDGKHLAAGGNSSPLVIMKTQPFETVCFLKDIARVTSLSFSFDSKFLLVASNDGKTTMMQWHNSKELLNLMFSSKFNEHLHSQFYFMDKFILQPEENQIALYAFKEMDTGFIKLEAGRFPFKCQNITAVGAVNQFYSNQIITALSNKNIEVFDTNAEKVGLTIQQAHTKPVSCIRINEAPKGSRATELCDFFMTSTYSNYDPIKIWDLKSAKCVLRISDINTTIFLPTSRPSLSPCGRYVATGLEDNSLILYDVRKINSRLMTFKGMKSSVLDCTFDVNFPMIWCGCRNGYFWNFYTQ